MSEKTIGISSQTDADPNEMTMAEKQKALLAAKPLGGASLSRLGDRIGTDAGDKARSSKSKLDDPIGTDAGNRSRSFSQSTTTQQKASPPKVNLFVDALPPGSDSTAPLVPFQLVVVEGGCQVMTYGSSVLDGTNGSNLVPLGLCETLIGVASTKSIVLQADINELVASNWTFAAVSTYDEVTMGGTPIEQTVARLLIGQIFFDGDTASAKQLVFTGQRLTYGFLNGKIVRVFESAPSHPNSIDV